MPLVTAPSRDLVLAGAAIAVEYAIALYDALYLVLSQHLSFPLIHADRKLHDRIGHLSGVIWIADYQSP
jgi:predicted nucleic acid-binding protein